MKLLDGRHVSSDVAVVEGEPCWWRHVTGRPAGEGTFDFWTIHAARERLARVALRRLGAAAPCRLHRHAQSGDHRRRAIEAHLRFSDQWPDLYGAGWVEALIGLYRTGVMELRRRRSP